MGNLLASPVTEKETHVGSTGDGEMEFGLSSMQGWRVHMEDAHIAEPNIYALDESEDDQAKKIPLKGHALYAVFDGHGGTYSAKYCGDNFCRVLSRQAEFVEYANLIKAKETKEFSSSAKEAQHMKSAREALEKALREAFVEIDQEIAMAIKGNLHPDSNQPYHPPENGSDAMDVAASDDTNSSNPAGGDESGKNATMAAAQRAAADHSRALDDDGDSGTTACMVLVTPDWLVCANAGDSRSVFSKQQRAVPLSYDHKPDDEEEERRIRAAGGYVAGGRVEGDLAVSRGLGDFRFKHMPTVLAGNQPTDVTMPPGEQKVSPIPDIIVQNRNAEQDEFIIVACDGIWDVRTNQECVLEVATMFEEGESDLGLISEELIDTCLRLGSKDNMTALIVKFKAQSIGEGGGVTARRQDREAKLKAMEGGETGDNNTEAAS